MSPALLTLAVVAAAFVALNVFVSGLRRRELRRRLETEWGQPRRIERDFEAIESYHLSRDARTMSLDARSWSDLTMDRIFEQIDRTESAIGRQLLYHRLHDLDPVDREAFESAVTGASREHGKRIKAQIYLAMISDADAYDAWRLTAGETPTLPRHYAIFPLLAGLSVAAVVVAPFWPPALAALVGVAVANLIARAATDKKLAQIRPAFRQVGPLLAAAKGLVSTAVPGTEPWIKELEQCVNAAARLSSIASWVARDPSRQNDLAAAVYEYINIAFAIDANALYFGIAELRLRQADLARAIALVGNIDAAFSVASWRSGLSDWTIPRIVGMGEPTRLEGICHPLVSGCVPNSVELGPPHGLIITGSNMSGKSTFLRTVGVTVALAQSINTALASSYSSPLLGLRSCIGRSDDITTGTSYYLAEVRAVLSIVRATETEQPQLILFDELFRGTNTAERLAAGEAVLETILAAGLGHLVLAATHDGELVDRLRPRYRPVHFSEQVTPAGLTFDYQLQPGPATTRNAIALLEVEQAPAGLVARARAALREHAAYDLSE